MKKKVLLIDDEPDFLDIMGQRIESWGYDVTVAADGNEGMDAFMTKSPDAIVLDYMMPDINGIQLLMKIRAVNMKIPVIMFTGKPKLEAMEDIKKLNILAFIPKLSTYADAQASLKTALAMAFKAKK